MKLSLEMFVFVSVFGSIIADALNATHSIGSWSVSPLRHEKLNVVRPHAGVSDSDFSLMSSIR